MPVRRSRIGWLCAHLTPTGRSIGRRHRTSHEQCRLLPLRRQQAQQAANGTRTAFEYLESFLAPVAKQNGQEHSTPAYRAYEPIVNLMHVANCRSLYEMKLHASGVRYARDAGMARELISPCCIANHAVSSAAPTVPSPSWSIVPKLGAAAARCPPESLGRGSV